MKQIAYALAGLAAALFALAATLAWYVSDADARIARLESDVAFATETVRQHEVALSLQDGAIVELREAMIARGPVILPPVHEWPDWLQRPEERP